MPAIDIPFRQILLDFHTSEKIAGIGSKFDPGEFAETLEKARVNSIICFSRCHHGWVYFDSKVLADRLHPHLTRNLLKEQIEACHAHNIRVPIYVTIQWDQLTSNRHPEWRVVEADGRLLGTPPYEAGFYRTLCLNSPYVDFLKPFVKEIIDTLPVDGFFFDYVVPVDDSSVWSRTQMEARGLDPSNREARRQFGWDVVTQFERDMTAFVRQFKDDCTIVYNGGHVGMRHRRVADVYTHFELESLPSGPWGYLDFPMTVRYARTLGKDCMGMTGRFHTAWGDFHSYRNVEALSYECFRNLAYGAKCVIGDQLHPTGKIDKYMYGRIGQVYGEVEQKEPWCKNAAALTDIGVLTPEEFQGGTLGAMPPALMGVTRMLEEGAHQFDIIDSVSDFSRYRVLILPDNIPCDETLGAKLEAYLASGGALIASFESGLNAAQSAFALKALGVRLKGEDTRDRDGKPVRGRHFEHGDYAEYILPRGLIGAGLPEIEHVMYMKGVSCDTLADSKVLAHKVLSYFDRTFEHFTSHRQTPSSGQIGDPAVVQNGRAIYLAHPIFTQYNQNAPRWCKQLVLNALSILLPEPLVHHSGPSTLLVTLNEQPREGRLVLHLLHYLPQRRSQEFDVIEDVIPLYNVKVSVRTTSRVEAVNAVPQGEPIAFEQKNARVEFTVPQVVGHQMVALLEKS